MYIDEMTHLYNFTISLVKSKKRWIVYFSFTTLVLWRFVSIGKSIGQQTNTQYCVFVLWSGIMPSVAMLNVVEMAIDETIIIFFSFSTLVLSRLVSIGQIIGQQTNTQYCMFVTQSGILPSVAMLSVIEMYIDEMTHLYNFTISLVKSKKRWIVYFSFTTLVLSRFVSIGKSIGQQTNTQYCVFVLWSVIMPSVAMLNVVEMSIDEKIIFFSFPSPS